MKTSNNPQFNQYYELHCKHLRLKGLLPKTIEAAHNDGSLIVNPLALVKRHCAIWDDSDLSLSRQQIKTVSEENRFRR